MKSPYLMKSDELTELCNFDIEHGGLKVRAGTKKLYGPFLGAVTGIERALTVKGHEQLFVSSPRTVEMVVAGIHANLTGEFSDFKVINTTDGFLYRFNRRLYSPMPLYRRVDGTISIEGIWRAFLILEPLESDYRTDGEFPSDLYGCNIIDSAANTLYYVSGHTNASKENIHSLLETDAFVRIGAVGDVISLYYNHVSRLTFDLKECISTNQFFLFSKINYLEQMLTEVELGGDVTGEALSCCHLVWHPASMRYFMAGNKTSPTALYISEPNDITTFYRSNILYPHLHLGKITGLNIVEKSVAVAYEYGWAHYVGSDPTEDAQWSLLSVPEGTAYGDSICQTPGSVSFLSQSGLISFSTSMLTVQMIYSPSSSLYKFLSRDKIRLPKPEQYACSYYKNGIYYISIDGTLYLYNFFLSAFLCYDGICCSCISEDYTGRLLMGNGNCIVSFCSDCSFDYDPATDTNRPICYRAMIPVLGAVNENEIARCEETVVKAIGLSEETDCRVKLSSELESREGKLLHTNHLLFGNTGWNYRYQDSRFCETFFPWKVSGNIFFLEISGETNPKSHTPIHILNIYLQMKKERNKI